jgi:hypothetical protein
VIASYFSGRRPADIFTEVEALAGRRLPDFSHTVAEMTLRRFRARLRAQHVRHALLWLCGPKCVASSSSLERIRTKLEVPDFFVSSNRISVARCARGDRGERVLK